MTHTPNTTPLRIAIAGLGKSGRDIHLAALQNLPHNYQVVGIFEPEVERAQTISQELGCPAYADYQALLADSSCEVVVVASPNRFHVPDTLAALQAGKHVVCEKPVARSTSEIDPIIRTAREHGRVYAPFLQRRYEPHVHKVKEVIDSGILGRIVQIQICAHKFARRWDWQTLRDYGGGELNNTLCHNIDHAMLFFPENITPRVFGDAQCCLTSGDAEDHVKIVMQHPGCPTIDVERSSSIAYRRDYWLVSGTAGGLRGTNARLEWKWVDWNTMPKRPVETGPRAKEQETLEWFEDSWTAPKDFDPKRQFYQDLYRTLREGQALVITPESVRRWLAVIEICKAQNGIT